jgi:O-methyltransferase involved in polyketide biosynthesis
MVTLAARIQMWRTTPDIWAIIQGMVTRDPSTISPSAMSLLVMKSQTAIPFARAAAEALYGADGVARELAARMNLRGAELRLRHFEARYRSIDTLLAEVRATRILELGAGLSFRGLALAERQPVFSLDTDLLEMAATKARLVATLHPGPLVGNLRIAVLDALDADGFRAAVAELPPGPIAVVNEGLLMYLGPAEKARLAGHAREALLARGGVWITADVYVQSPPDARIEQSEQLRRFLEEHRVEENKFANWETAERFFIDQGLAIERRLSPSEDLGGTRESWVLSARR